MLSALFDFLAAHQTSVLAAGVDILLNLVSGLLEAIPELVAALPEIISAITQGMAKAGKSYEQILGFFYEGTELREVSGQ